VVLSLVLHHGIHAESRVHPNGSDAAATQARVRRAMPSTAVPALHSWVPRDAEEELFAHQLTGNAQRADVI
jgi:hypothetical protein